MGGIRPSEGRVRGVKAHCWPVSAIPAPLYQELSAIAHRNAYCNVADLLDSPPEEWQPDHPLQDFTDAEVQKATERRNILCPILSADDAQLVEFVVLARRALPGFRSSVLTLAASERSLCRLIERVVHNDRMMLRWDRVELYLDPKPTLKTLSKETVAVEVGGARLAELLKSPRETDEQQKEWGRLIWDAIFREYEARVSGGVSPGAAKRKLLHILRERAAGFLSSTSSGCSMAWKRLHEKWEKGGKTPNALIDGRNGIGGGKSTVGRKASGYVTEQEGKDIRSFVRRSKEHHRVTGLLHYARSPKCVRPELRAEILRHRKSRHNMPEWLMKAATLRPNDRLKQIGERSYRAEAFYVQRGGFEIIGEGMVREIEAGDWWLFDDVTQNHPFWFENVLEDEDDDLARKQKVSICRQSLMAMDFRSGRWLGCELVGRSRDSYRAEDILRFFFRLFTIYGLPRRGIILERGIWKSKVIVGTREKTVTIPEEEQERVIDGLAQLGIEVRHALDAKGKALIESGFRHYQDNCAIAFDGLYVGSEKNPCERGMKQFMRARSGVVHPTRVNMLHIDRASEENAREMNECNTLRKEGEIQNGVPDEVWDRSLVAKPLRPMPMDKLPVFLPTRREATIRGGHVRPKVNGSMVGFINAPEFAWLGEGYHVRVHFDASEPTLGAWVYNQETSTLNARNYKVGEFICYAEFAELAPAVAPAGYVDDNIRRRKAYNAASVRIAFAPPARAGQKIVTVREARDGQGGVVRVEAGAQIAPADGTEILQLPRRRGSPRSDELAEKAKAMRRQQTPQTVTDWEKKRLATLDDRERAARAELGYFD